MAKHTEFTTYVEIPVTVRASRHPAEGNGWHEPHYRVHVRVDDIELPPDIKGYIMGRYYDALVEEAEEVIE